MSKFDQLLTRYNAARQHDESCIKKLQQVLDHLRSDWEWPEQEHKSTKHRYHHLRCEKHGEMMEGHSEIFGHGAFTIDAQGRVHTALSVTVSEEHVQSPLSVRLSIARAGSGKWLIQVDGDQLEIRDDDDASMRALSHHIFGRIMTQLESRHWAPQPANPAEDGQGGF